MISSWFLILQYLLAWLGQYLTLQLLNKSDNSLTHSLTRYLYLGFFSYAAAECWAMYKVISPHSVVSSVYIRNLISVWKWVMWVIEQFITFWNGLIRFCLLKINQPKIYLGFQEILEDAIIWSWTVLKLIEFIIVVDFFRFKLADHQEAKT